MAFQALLLTKNQDEHIAPKVEITTLNLDDLPAGEVLIKIDYSTLNYKDALAISNQAPIAKISPLVLGIDGVGTVISSEDARYHAGQKVVVNGWGLGEKYWGCLAQYARLQADWLIPLPESISAWEAMAIGTAGYTAALAVSQLIQAGVKPEDGNILVTGATGGVGSIAIALLAKLGYRVTATTGKKDADQYLHRLGAAHIINRSLLSAAGKPLQTEQWTGAIDTAGSDTLANICAQMRYEGIVIACGRAQGIDFPVTVAPFILRGISLFGINSVTAPYSKRLAAWALLAKQLDRTLLPMIATTIKLSEYQQAVQAILAGNVTGRLVVDVNALA